MSKSKERDHTFSGQLITRRIMAELSLATVGDPTLLIAILKQLESSEGDEILESYLASGSLSEKVAARIKEGQISIVEIKSLLINELRKNIDQAPS